MEFRKTDMGYYEKNSQEGTLQKIKYNSNTYDIQNKIIEKDA